MGYNFSGLESYRHESSKVLVAYEDSARKGWAICKLEDRKWGVYNLTDGVMHRVVRNSFEINRLDVVIHTQPIWHRPTT